MTFEIAEQRGTYSLAPRNLDEAFRLADVLASSELVPKDFRGKPANCLIAMQWGAEVGLKPLQALQNIAVINGRPSLWGDAVLALVRASPVCEHVVETLDADGTAVCRVKRRGEPEQVRTFSDADAQTAGLKGKDGPWRTAPKRMKQMRARAFALRDVFADVLKGMPIAEEVIDMPTTTVETPPPSRIEPAAKIVPAELLNRARAAADLGRVPFLEYWRNLAAPERELLRHEVDALKLRTEQADAKAAADVGQADDGQAQTAARAADADGVIDESFLAAYREEEVAAGGAS